MRYAVTTGAAGAELGPDALAELAALAEASGWDGIFLEDYLVYQARDGIATFDPWICLAAMAAATTRIRLGLTVVPLPRRRPWTVAAQAVAIDQLSGGRMILGVGSGNPADPDFAATGDAASPRVLAERLDESLLIIDALWSGEPVSYAGRHYRLDGLRLAARPVQRPRIPIWVGGNLALGRVRRRIAAWDGSCAYYRAADGREILPHHLRGLRDQVRGRSDGGRSFDIKIGDSDDPELIKELEEAGATWWSRWLDPADPVRVRRLIAEGPPVRSRRN
jgi:hypothetical protein